MNSDLQTAALAELRRSIRSDDRTGMVRAASVLLKQRAQLGNDWFDLSRHLVRWAELGKAIDAHDLWKQQGADVHEAEYGKAVLFARMGRPDIALTTLAAVSDDKPKPFANAYLRASIATSFGDADEAEMQFRRTIAALPASGRSWHGIVQLGRATKADEKQIRHLASKAETLDATDHASLENALGILAHNRHDHAEAFAHFSRCTEILGRSLRYSAKDNQDSAAVAGEWDRAALGRLAEAPRADARKPIFVTGLPRSGTTLVEQILSAHSGVDGGGELGLALQLEATANGFSPADIDRYLRQGGSHENLRALYQRLVADRIPGSGMFVDKSLNQSRSLGPFSALFPDAPVIWMRRDRLDNAWSMYRAWLTDNAVGGWSLSDIAHHMRIEDRMLAHWQEVLGDRLLALDYAELVANPEKSIDRLCDHCGLTREPLQLTPHLAGGSVTTASAQQVRQPINKKGLGVAEPYKRWLTPFIAVYFADSAQRATTGSADETPAYGTSMQDGRTGPMTDAEARTRLLDLKAGLARRDRAAVNRSCKKLIEGEAPLGKQWKAIVTVLQHNGEHDLACDAARIWTEQQPRNDNAAFECAAVLARAGRLDEAAALLEALPDTLTDAAETEYLRGTVAMNRGLLGEARAHLRGAIAASPASGQSWLALAMADLVEERDHEALLAAEPGFTTAPPVERAAFLYAKGRMLERDKQPDAAFAAIDEGARIMAGQARYGVAADRADSDSARTGWTAPAIAAINEQARKQSTSSSDRPDRPIFVTGLPRSGTTLVEQILVSHSEVDGGEELGLFRLLEQDIGGRSKADFDAYLAAGGSAQSLRALYDHLVAQRFPGTGRVVDKTLNASRHMGLIAALYPDAPIIWLRRDPLDCAWSAYRTWFLRGLDWNWKLEDIAAHFAIEDALFDHWTGLLGKRVLVVPYADLVAEPERWIGAITRHCGLEPEPAQLTPHETARTVTTASVTQVREPINTRGIGAAQPYRKHLAPFLEAYRT